MADYGVGAVAEVVGGAAGGALVACGETDVITGRGECPRGLKKVHRCDRRVKSRVRPAVHRRGLWKKQRKRTAYVALYAAQRGPS